VPPGASAKAWPSAHRITGLAEAFLHSTEVLLRRLMLTNAGLDAPGQPTGIPPDIARSGRISLRRPPGPRRTVLWQALMPVITRSSILMRSFALQGRSDLRSRHCCSRKLTK
jgi:hypothetical protein